MATSHKREANARPGLRSLSSLRQASRSSSSTPSAGKHSAAPLPSRDASPFGVSTVKVIAAPLAVVATIAGAWTLIDVAAPSTEAPLAGVSADLGRVGNALGTGSSVGAERAAVVSRSKERDAEVAESVRDILDSQEDVELRAAEEAAQAATRKAIAGADTELWTTDVLNLWTDPEPGAVKIGEIDAGKQVLVTGRSEAGREEIVIDGRARWVSAGYLDAEKPVAGIGGVCSNGSSVASGVSASIAKVHSAVCAAFPSISTYGTLRGGGGDHPQGRAVDIMVSGALGYQVADFVRANASELGVSYVIYSQRIWSVERGGEGWRGMSNRGSSTANHYDHVHVSVF